MLGIVMTFYEECYTCGDIGERLYKGKIWLCQKCFRNASEPSFLEIK